MNGTIVVPGVPVAKQRARQGRGGHWYTPPATREAENAIALLTRATQMNVGDSDVKVDITFVVSSRSGDLDNEIKTVLDGITKGEGWQDDKQVVEIHARYLMVDVGQERTVVNVEPV